MTPTGPTPPAVPPAPPGDYYDATQWAVLTSLLDAVIPSIAPASKVTDEKTHRGIDDAEYEKLASLVEAKVNPAPSPEALKAYLDDRPSANPGFMNGLLQALGNLPQSARARLGGVLSALGTRYGSLLLTGSTVPVHEQSLADREAVLQRWSSSWFGTPRVLYKTFTSLAKVTWLQTAVYAEAAGFPAVPTNWKPVESAFEFDFLQFSATTSDDEPAVVETDVVIVGSGCGGGVAAKVLAEAGHRVLVVDKGYYFPPSQLPMTADGGAFHLLENNGLISSVDSSVNVVGGSCWGGGGTVNWSVSLHTQGFVRKEWAEEHGLPFFESAEYQDCLDRVCDFMGVIRGDQVRQTHRGKMLLEGSRRLGWPAEVCPQNTGGKEHWCGHCHLGCGAGEKQGPAVSWLPHAARNGAKFAEGFAVDHILWDETDTSGDKVATGIRGTWTSRDSSGATIGSDRTTRQVIVKAKKVIVSAGTLNSPLVLMKSGLTVGALPLCRGLCD
ncbi:long chain fatty alcohol oxidase [Echria macrotheca]|uniref:Long chain fatty alcohol oxidase n=1 Tax=Echria macrotheca TaxID=438768 RepID=A0AAJ0B821_9PEZI|nr:long chain fatty alcohol oxidase [Echria macrotheca]